MCKDKFNNSNNKKNLKNKFSKTNDTDEKNNVSPNPSNPTNQNNSNNKRRRRYYSKKNKKNINNQLVLHKTNNPKNAPYQDYWFYLNPDDLTTLYYYTPNSFDYNTYDNSNYSNTKNILDNKISNGTQTGNYDDKTQLNQDINYYLNPFSWSEDLEKNTLEKLKTKSTQIVKELKWIKLPEINNLDDLIKIGKQWGTTWSDEFDYNINLKLLNYIVPELEELNLMIGLNEVKSQIIDLIIYWALGLDNINHDLLHTVIEGEPGTGKTELAEKLAKIYLKLGILKSNVFKKVKRADLVAGYLGQTAIKTAKIIEECKGGVLFIDEAYSLGNAEGKDGKDSFSKECIDTLNQALTESKSDFVCIIAGYTDDLSKSFFSYNSGLERRFPIRFSIGTYTDEELGKIFIKKVQEYEWKINLSPEELSSIIKSNRRYFKFNGGDMEILFAKCKISHSKNLLKTELKVKKVLDKSDILDGIQLYLLNPQIKSRGEEDNIKKYIHNTMYI
jgi:hypothetical protein